jgi:hypothetical protein
MNLGQQSINCNSGGVQKMDKSLEKKLLKKREVVEEINRHLWIESEKAGFDLGFEKAKIDWLESFSKAWINYHMPGQKTQKTGRTNRKGTFAKSYVKGSSNSGRKTQSKK